MNNKLKTANNKLSSAVSVYNSVPSLSGRLSLGIAIPAASETAVAWRRSDMFGFNCALGY